MGLRARSVPLALLVLYLPGVTALRSGPSQEQVAHNRRQRGANTIGGGREVWIVARPTRAPRASLPQHGGEGPAEQVLLLQQSSSGPSSDQTTSVPFRRQLPAAELAAASTTVQAPAKSDDIEAQVSALEGFITLSAEVVENMKDSASTYNSSAAKGNATTAVKSLQEIFSAASSGMDFYKNSAGELQGLLWSACGGNLGIYAARYGWMEQFKNTLNAMTMLFRNVSETIAASADLAPESLTQQICPYLGTILPVVNNVSAGYAAQLWLVVSLANGNTTILGTEPIKTGVKMIYSAMRTVKVQGLFLEEDGVAEQVCRSAVVIANTKLGCNLELPWVAPPATGSISKEDEKKVEKAVKDLKKLAGKGMPWMPSNHMRLVVIVCVICGVMTLVAFWMCMQLPLELLAVPFVLVFHVVKGAFMVVIGLLFIVAKIVTFPVVKCSSCFRRNKEDTLEAIKDSKNSGIPQDVLEKMPLDVRLMHKGGDTLKEAVNVLTEADKAKQTAETSSQPKEATVPNHSAEHPMYRKFGLDPTTLLRRQYERKK